MKRAKPPVLTMQLDLPPSVNAYWRSVTIKGRGNVVLISKEGREYRAYVQGEVLAAGVPNFTGRLRAQVTMFPPDARRRDLDNILKALLDALQHAGVYADDGQIDDLHIMRGQVIARGGVHVRIEEIAAVPVPIELPLRQKAEAPGDRPF